MKKLNKLFKFLVLMMPAVLFFSYEPVISFGSGETMNFELSLPLIWLVVFNGVAAVLIMKNGKYKEIGKRWLWLLFPVFATISLFWSHDRIRGLLTVGILWLIYIAIFSLWAFRKEIFEESFWRKFLMVFFGAGLLVCAWCLIQCVLDLVGVSRDVTLLCPGCVYGIFGFPHPNGFAAEPQFMGNLLLAPIFVALYAVVEKKFFNRRISLALFFVFVFTLFITLSRGAIYAFVVGLIFFTVYIIVKKKRWRIIMAWGAVALAFVMALCVQGVMAELSKTDDTYISGVSKAVNQLTLGVVDLGGGNAKKETVEDVEETDTAEQVETNEADNTMEEAVFDGYVEVSTDSRVDSWKGALEIWSRDMPTVLFGVGLGGGPVARYEEGKYNTPKEIVNNEYINVLFEMGLVGIALLVLTVVLVWRVAMKSKFRIIAMSLIVAYAVTLCFFSGLPNALHIYLLTAVFALNTEKKKMQKE